MSLLRRLLETPQRAIPAIDGRKTIPSRVIASLHHYYHTFSEQGYVCTHAGHVVVPYPSSPSGEKFEVVSPFLFLQTPQEHHHYTQNPQLYAGSVLYADTGIFEQVIGGWQGVAFKLEERRLLKQDSCSRWGLDSNPVLSRNDYEGRNPGRFFHGVAFADQSVHGKVFDPQVSVRDCVYGVRNGLFVANPTEQIDTSVSLDEHTETLLKDA